MTTTTTQNASTVNAECVECAAPIEAQITMAGEILDCAECGVELEVRSVNPLQIAVAPQVEEDWGE